MMDLPDLIPDSEAVLAAAWFEQDGKLKAATGHTQYPWDVLEQLTHTLSRHLDMAGEESLEWLVFEEIQLFTATRSGEGLVWIAPAEADTHWLGNGLILTLANLQQQEAELKERPSEEVLAPNGVSAEAKPIPETFMKDLEKVLSKAMGPTVAGRLIVQTASQQEIDARTPLLYQLDGLIHEISLQIPYRGRRSIFLTEVHQLMRSHQIPPKRIAYPSSKRMGNASYSLGATSR